MRKMNKKEINDFITNQTWATLCTVDAGGNPYAIEFNYFQLNGHICGLIKASGMTATNIENNPNVCLKICKTDESCREFQAVSCFGKGEYVDDPHGVLIGWDLLEERLKLPKGTYTHFKDKFLRKKNKYPLFWIKVEKMTGVTSLKK